MAPRSTQPFILPRSIKWLQGIFGNLVVKSKLPPQSCSGSFHHVKSTIPSHLTHMDFPDILSSQCTHQEMKILKILSSYHERFQNYDHLNYGPSSLDNKPLQFMTFWNCSYSASFNSKHQKFWMGIHFLEVFTTKNLFNENFENYASGGVLKLSNWPLQYFFHIFSGL